MQGVLRGLLVLFLVVQGELIGAFTPPKTSEFYVSLPSILALSLRSKLKHALFPFYPTALPVEPVITGSMIHVHINNCHLTLSSLATAEIKRPTFVLIDYKAVKDCSLPSIASSQLPRSVQSIILVDSVCHCEGSDPVQSDHDYTAKCKELASEQSLRVVNAGSYCANELPRLDDQNPTGNIDVHSMDRPVAIIDFVSGQRIIDCLNGVGCLSKSTVVGTLRWAVRTNPVIMEMITSPERDGVFMQRFADIVEKLEGSVIFLPRQLVHRSDSCKGDVESSMKGYCSQFCEGAYCTGGSMAHNGRLVVQESLRRICIYRQSAERSSVGVPWWRYVKEFTRDCTDFSEACSYLVQGRIKALNPNETSSCVRSSWKADQTNILLENEINHGIGITPAVFPSVFINGLGYKVNPVSPDVSVIEGLCKLLSVPVPICECVSKGTSLDPTCIDASCSVHERFCAYSHQCLPDDDKFGDNCYACPYGLKVCINPKACVSIDEECPECSDPTEQYYCVTLRKCVSSAVECLTQSEQNFVKRQALDPIAVTIIVALIVAIALLLAYSCWWRRTRVTITSEVRDIFEQYRPIEGASRSQPSRPRVPLASFSTGDSALEQT